MTGKNGPFEATVTRYSASAHFLNKTKNDAEFFGSFS
jgi:hypothetical protein